METGEQVFAPLAQAVSIALTREAGPRCACWRQPMKTSPRCSARVGRDRPKARPNIALSQLAADWLWKRATSKEGAVTFPRTSRTLLGMSQTVHATANPERSPCM